MSAKNENEKCPFCGTEMIEGEDKLGKFVAHPPTEIGGTYKKSDDCVLHYGRFHLNGWNTRTGQMKYTSI